jgi:hypothetical protein
MGRVRSGDRLFDGEAAEVWRPDLAYRGESLLFEEGDAAPDIALVRGAGERCEPSLDAAVVEEIGEFLAHWDPFGRPKGAARNPAAVLPLTGLLRGKASETGLFLSGRVARNSSWFRRGSPSAVSGTARRGRPGSHRLRPAPRHGASWVESHGVGDAGHDMAPSFRNGCGGCHGLPSVCALGAITWSMLVRGAP